MPDPKVTQPYFGQPNKVIRVTSLEQLSLAQFIGELVRPKVYENDHRNVLGIWIDLEWNIAQVSRIFLIFMKIIKIG